MKKKKKKTDMEKTVRTGQTRIMTRNIWNVKEEGEISLGYWYEEGLCEDTAVL